MSKFKGEKVKGRGKFSCLIVFVIERDGKIGDVKVTGKNESLNKEAERALRKVDQIWTPAKIDGTAVRYRFKMPIGMDF